MTTTTEQLEANTKLARDYIDQVFNQHNPSKAAGFVTGDVVWHGNSLGDIADAENLAGPLGTFIGALPDLYAAEQDITAENHLVMVRLVVTATVKGSLLGVPGDGKPVRWNAVDIYRVTDGRSTKNRRPTTSRPSWPSSVSSARRGPPDISPPAARPARERTPA